MKPTLLSLFSGIGGIDLAFERAGFEVKGQVELDDYCVAILAKHWPDVPRWRDVRTFGRADFLGSVDVVAGGFPCQDISAAGKGAGIKEGTRSGLWFEFARIIGELRPRYAFLENVPAITTRDGVRVLADLAALGYDARWGIVAASGVGAPHRRERWFCLAYRDRDGLPGSPAVKVAIPDQEWNLSPFEPTRDTEFHASVAGGEDVGNPAGVRRLRYPAQSRSAGEGETGWRLQEPARRSPGVGQADASCIATDGLSVKPRDDGREAVGVRLANADSLNAQARAERAWGMATSRPGNRSVESRLGGIFDGLPARLDTARRQARWPAPPGQAQYEWEAPRTSQGEANRTARLKALGNSVVPQVIQPFAEGLRQALEADYLGGE